jgi:hypothetical protein
MNGEAGRSTHGINPDLSRRVGIAGRSIWLTVGAEIVCRIEETTDSDYAEPCQTTANAKAGLLAGSENGGTIPPGEAIVSGVVPDGPSVVTVSFAGGTTRTVDVVDNVYTFTATSDPTISFTDASGQIHTIGPMPVLPR